MWNLQEFILEIQLVVYHPFLFQHPQLENVKNWTKLIAQRLNVVGLINLQFAVTNTNNKENKLFILEANPRASRTVPFVSKAIGKPVAKLATQLMQGFTLEDVNFTRRIFSKISSSKRGCFTF